MDRAFRAPRYDGYFDRHWQLTREVWNHHPDLSASVIFNSLSVHSLPDVPSIRNYGNYLVHSAPRASDAGHAAEAETLLKRVDGFGRRMSEQGQTDFEQVVGLTLSYRATTQLRNLYQAQGNEHEVRQAERRLKVIDVRIDGLVHSFQRLGPAACPRLRSASPFRPTLRRLGRARCLLSRPRSACSPWNCAS